MEKRVDDFKSFMDGEYARNGIERKFPLNMLSTFLAANDERQYCIVRPTSYDRAIKEFGYKDKLAAWKTDGERYAYYCDFALELLEKLREASGKGLSLLDVYNFLFLWDHFHPAFDRVLIAANIERLKAKGEWNGKRFDYRAEKEAEARKLCEDKVGSFSREEGERLFALLDSDLPGGREVHGRFGLSFIGSNRELLLQDMGAFNQWSDYLYGAPEAELQQRVEGFMKMKPLKGAGSTFVSALLYLRDKNRFNIVNGAIIGGLAKVLENKALDKRKLEYYFDANWLLICLREEIGLRPESLDLLLSNIVPVTPARDIYEYVERANLHFPPSLVTDYLLALKTKPFVILTGVSGTGKTKLAQLVADYFTEEDKERVAFVPVRPDWTDNQGLLGFYNLITQRYEPTELLKLLLRAAEDLENPYFLILDEMNLAKVEHYFSDFLSCLESGTPILLHDQPEDLSFSDGKREYLIPPRLQIPENLYITGTVNVDETTYMFSPKVLDRAFTLEFDRVETGAYLGLEEASSEEDFRLKEGFTLLPQEHATRAHASSLSPGFKGLLASLEEMLEPYRLHFGYRVINEISLYLANAGENVSESPTAADTAFDLCLLHKVLPKLHGNRGELEEPLARLLFFCFEMTPPGDPAGSFESFQAGPPLLYESQDEGRSPRFPRTAAKVHRMWSTLRTRGFVSFVE
ncbi:MAG: AAA family ATPase [Actinobacteria bacterium]|nr:AAA family ATPase [Actinomycetota bacterium]